MEKQQGKQMKWLHLILALLVFLLAACNPRSANLGYDPNADPVAALATAKADAARTNRRVLVIAGGDWCRWCHVLNKFLDDEPDVEAELDRRFVNLKVYYGDENTNDAFFAALPETNTYPHFWVIDQNGTAHSYGTGDLESGGDSYDRERFLRFLREAGGDAPN